MRLASKLPFWLRHLLPLTPQSVELRSQQSEAVQRLTELRKRLPAEVANEFAIPAFTHRNPIMRWLSWERLAVALEWLDATALAPSVVMDFGCGTGLLLQALSRRGHRVLACDIRPDVVEAAIAPLEISEVEILDATRDLDKLQDGSVDAILALEVLEHVDDVPRLAACFRKLLRPGGVLLCSLPTENVIYRAGRRLAGFSGSYHRHGIAEVIAGLRTSLDTKPVARLFPFLPLYDFFECRPLP